MRIRLGYEVSFDCPQPTPMVLMLQVHPSRRHDLLKPDTVMAMPGLETSEYQDGFGNICTRLIAPPGKSHVTTDAMVMDSGLPDLVMPDAIQHDVPALPPDALVFLLGSRYCDTEKLSAFAWAQFGAIQGGWARVQAICDFVHGHIRFGYQHARCTRTASEAYEERVGVCRDFAHLAITLCRSMNIPARYCTGYLGDIGVPADPAPMDFSAWFEAYIGGHWYTFDARHNHPRIGRVLIARGRDAADVAISTTFGSHQLAGFKVWTDEIPDGTHDAQPASRYAAA